MRLYNSSYKGFLNYVFGKNILCYGAGRMLQEMAGELPELLESCNSFFITDGDMNKIGTERKLFGRAFYVRNIEELDMDQNFVVLITSSMVTEILDALSRVIDGDCPVFSLLAMRRETQDRDVISVNDSEMAGKMNETQIPRIIHYFWFGKSPIPEKYAANINTWRNFCPDYDFILWNENNCDLNECKYAKEAYMHGKFAFVPDFFRLKRIYEIGGIYLDLDVEILKPLDELRFLQAYSGFEDNNHVAFGVGFGAKKGFKLIKEMYEDYQDRSFEKNDGTLNLTASPVYQTEILKSHGLICNGDMQVIEGMTILPMNYLTVQSPHTGKKYLTKRSFSIHKYAASWTSENDRRNKSSIEAVIAKAETI